MSDQRPYKLTVGLTDKEALRVREYAQKHQVSRANIMVQALRLYDAIESGRVTLLPLNAPSGAGF